MPEIVTKVIGWIIQVLPIFIILRPRPRTYASTSPLLLLQLHHQQQQLLSINTINSTNHHLQHAKLRILLQHLTSHAAYERSGGPPKRPAAKRPCIHYDRTRTVQKPTGAQQCPAKENIDTRAVLSVSVRPCQLLLILVLPYIYRIYTGTAAGSFP